MRSERKFLFVLFDTVLILTKTTPFIPCYRRRSHPGRCPVQPAGSLTLRNNSVDLHNNASRSPRSWSVAFCLQVLPLSRLPCLLHKHVVQENPRPWQVQDRRPFTSTKQQWWPLRLYLNLFYDLTPSEAENHYTPTKLTSHVNPSAEATTTIIDFLTRVDFFGCLLGSRH